MTSIELGRHKFEIPASIAEVPTASMDSVLAVVFEGEGDKRVDALYCLTPKKARRDLGKLNEVQLVQLLELLDWINEPIPTTPMLPEVVVGKVTYLSPQALMSSSVFAEVMFADVYFNALSSDPSQLTKLAACLYRPADPAKELGDRRIKFDSDRLEEDAANLARLSYEKLSSIVAFYSACKRQMMQLYEEAFDTPPENSEGEFTTQPVSNPLERWVDMLMMVADSNVFGNIEEVKYANMHEVLMYLVRLRRKNEAARLNKHV